MTTHMSDWGDSLNRCRSGGKQNTMVMLFVGGAVLMLDRIWVLFLLSETYGAGVFLSHPNPYRGQAVNSLAAMGAHERPLFDKLL